MRVITRYINSTRNTYSFKAWGCWIRLKLYMFSLLPGSLPSLANFHLFGSFSFNFFLLFKLKSERTVNSEWVLLHTNYGSRLSVRACVGLFQQRGAVCAPLCSPGEDCTLCFLANSRGVEEGAVSLQRG